MRRPKKATGKCLECKKGRGFWLHQKKHAHCKGAHSYVPPTPLPLLDGLAPEIQEGSQLGKGKKEDGTTAINASSPNAVLYGMGGVAQVQREKEGEDQKQKHSRTQGLFPPNFEKMARAAGLRVPLALRR